MLATSLIPPRPEFTLKEEVNLYLGQLPVKTNLVIAKGLTNAPGGGGTPLFGLYGDVPLDRVWFFGLAVLNRVYNLTCLCPKRVKNLS